MRSTSASVFTLAFILFSSSTLANHRMIKQLRRQIIPGIGNPNGENSAGAGNVATTTPEPTGSTITITTGGPTTTDTNAGGGGGNFFSSIASIVDPNRTTTPSITPIVITSQSTTTTSTPTSSTRSTNAPKTSSTGPAIVQITSTSTIAPSSISTQTSTPTALANASPSPSSSGGVSKATLIPIIVIASAVGLVAAIWTLIRKWKLGPSRRFEDKLNPIDFVDEYGQTRVSGGPSATTLERNGSLGSLEGQHKRSHSFESAIGSQVAMSESGAHYPPSMNASVPWQQQLPPPVAPLNYAKPSLSNPYDPTYVLTPYRY